MAAKAPPVSAQDELRRGLSDLRPVLSGALIADLRKLAWAAIDAERARVKAVERLAEPMGEYHHHAVELDDGVHLAVLVEDLRDALAR